MARYCYRIEAPAVIYFDVEANSEQSAIKKARLLVDEHECDGVDFAPLPGGRAALDSFKGKLVIVDTWTTRNPRRKR